MLRLIDSLLNLTFNSILHPLECSVTLLIYALKTSDKLRLFRLSKIWGFIYSCYLPLFFETAMSIIMPFYNKFIMLGKLSSISDERFQLKEFNHLSQAKC